MAETTVEVRLSAGGKKGILGRWDMLKPAILFRPDTTYSVTPEAYRAQKHILELVEVPAPSATPVVPEKPAETPKEVSAPSETTESAPSPEESAPATTETAPTGMPVAPPSRKYGKKEG